MRLETQRDTVAESFDSIQVALRGKVSSHDY